LRHAREELREVYKTRTLLLNWEPAGGGRFEVDDPIAAAKAAAPVLGAIVEALAARPRPPVPLALLTQSMGAFAFAELGRRVAANRFTWPMGLFGTIVVSAPATPASSHATWLAPLARLVATYVVVNHDDRILRLLDLRTDTPLGRRLDGVALAPGVTYVDLSGFNRNMHRYFAPDRGVATLPASARGFYEQVLRGQQAELSAFRAERGQIRHLS
jgi:hypothetical protein